MENNQIECSNYFYFASVVCVCVCVCEDDQKKIIIVGIKVFSVKMMENI